MKKPLLSFIFMALVLPLVAWGETDNPNDLINAVKSLDGLEKDVNASSSVKSDCTNCKTIEPDRKLDLKNKTEDLEKLFIYKNNVPFVIHLKRTKETPLKTTVKFKNGHTECGRMYYGANPFNGALIVECLVKVSVFYDEELDLNLKKLPLPADGEEQIIEVRITKPNCDNERYSVEASVLKGPVAAVKIDKQFWGAGYNLNFEAKEEGKP